MAGTSNLCALAQAAVATGPIRPAGLRDFLRDDKGAATVEFVALVPFFVMLLVFFADASAVYLTHSQMYATARDISRRMAVEEITTEGAVRNHAAAHLFLGNRTYAVASSFGGDMSVTISLSLGDAAIFGALLTPIIGRQLAATAVTRREPLG